MAECRCTVVIPTKNAITVLPKVMEKVLAQKTPWPFQVIAIDSGSTDGTSGYLRTLDRVRLVEIPPGEFGHGKTRNLGVQLAESEFVAFLTHDAQPVDENWLANLVRSAEDDPLIAGVFGRHRAYENASAFTKSDLDKHFEGFLAFPLAVSRDLDPDRYETDVGWRQMLHFFSDNNSLLRKSVWELHPYPDVEFAEDQIWAKSIIEAGYIKAYAPDAVVYHSHEYGVFEQLRRAFDESRNFSKYFGYKLSPDPLQAVSSAVRLAVRGWHERVDERYGQVLLRQRLRRAGQRAALVAGHCLGANHEKLPLALSTRLSLDQKLFRA